MIYYHRYTHSFRKKNLELDAHCTGWSHVAKLSLILFRYVSENPNESYMKSAFSAVAFL